MKNEGQYANEADDHLSDILKMVDLQEPSDQFVDRVMVAYSSQKSRKNFKVAKAPLYLMASLGLLLFLPWVMGLTEIMVDNTRPKPIEMIHGCSLAISIWYIVCPIVLLLSLATMALIEMRSISRYKTNTPTL